MKKLFRILLFAAVVAGVVWLTRERMLPEPPPPDEHPPPFRTPPQSRPSAQTSVAPSSEPAPADDLQRVKGIGPVYERKLHGLGIESFSALIRASSDEIAEKLEVNIAAVVDWKTQATELLA